MPNIGVPELLIVLVIALVVLGPKKLPEVGRSLGKGMREFKDSIAGIGDDDDDDEAERNGLPAPAPSVDVASTQNSTASPENQTTPS